MSNVKEAINLLKEKIALARITLDNENYLMPLTIKDGKHLIKLLESEPEADECINDKCAEFEIQEVHRLEELSAKYFEQITDLEAKLKAKDELLGKAFRYLYEQ